MIIQAEKNKTWRSDHDQTPLTTLCALALVTTGSIPAPGRRGGYRRERPLLPPSQWEEYTYGNRMSPASTRCISSPSQTIPPVSPGPDFVRNGRLYYLLDMTRKDEVGVDTKPHTETVTRPSDTDNMEEILQGLEAELRSPPRKGTSGCSAWTTPASR